MKTKTFRRVRFFAGAEALTDNGWLFGVAFYGGGGPIDDNVAAGVFVALFLMAFGVEFLQAE